MILRQRPPVPRRCRLNSGPRSYGGGSASVCGIRPIPPSVEPAHPPRTGTIERHGARSSRIDGDRPNIGGTDQTGGLSRYHPKTNLYLG